MATPTALIAPAPARTTAPAAEVRRLSHRYRGRTVLSQVDLSIAPGSMVGVIGSDAVGKSTLLGLIAGVRRIQQGDVRVLGGSLRSAAHRAAVCRRIGYMPQGLGRALHDELSVRENLLLLGGLFDLPVESLARRIQGLLEFTGLAPFAGRRAADLSGGMRQKLALTAALLHDPAFLILDEPTSGIDPLSRRQTWELIAAMRRQRPALTVLVATAHMEEAGVADRLVLMDEGRILAEGAPEELLRQAGAETLDQTYIALLRAARRSGSGAATAAPRTPGAEAAVAIQGLTRRFGDFTAVRDVSLEVRRGEIFGLVGPNGSGKTTLLRTVCGLLAPTAGTVRLFGRPVDPRDQRLHRRLGYMSQSFSLYTELSVRQNLALHGRLFGLPEAGVRSRVRELADRFAMTSVLDEVAEDLPLGMRQRLSLAVAVIHEPELLILDEPTSGVDPVARDTFWHLLADLASYSGATIVVSTHNLVEASRCDRVALMHAGVVLACDTPAALRESQRADTLDEAFISLLRSTGGSGALPPAAGAIPRPAARNDRPEWRAAPRRLGSLCRREALEILRDRFHLVWAVAVPLALLLIFGFGLSLDLDHLPFAVLDRDRTPESRAYIDRFAATPYFDARPPAATEAELERRLQLGELRLALEIPAGFGRELRRGRSPTVGGWIDGTMPYRGEGTEGYAMAAQESFVGSLRAATPAAEIGPRLEVRYWFNQSLESKYAFVPALLAVVLLLMPATLTAVAVVREKEFGSITLLYATPMSRLEFALGKQFPHAVIGFVNFAAMALLVVAAFDVPLRGSLAALSAGAALFVLAGTGLGLVVGAFSRTQTAAVFVTLILVLIPSFQFSGVLFPVSALRGPAYLLGRCFPTSYFVSISTAAFSKGLGFGALWPNHLALAGFAVGLTAAGALLLRKQGE